ncbi:MAG: EpsG family protein [Bacteroidaceae bacterium]
MKESRYNSVIILASMTFVLIMVAGFRPIGIDNDSLSYVQSYQHPTGFLEISFLFISDLVRFIFNDVRALFVIYALLGVIIKVYAIDKLTNLLFLSMAVYVSNFFILHEMTQIRVGVAAGLFLLSLKFIYDQKKKMAVFSILGAFLFHYSAVTLLPFLFMRTGSLNRIERFICIFIIPIAYLFSFTGLDLLSSIPIPYIQQKLTAYKEIMDMGLGDTVNIFSLLFLMKVILYYLLLWKESIVRESDERISMFLRVEVASLASLILFSSIPVISFRLNELYGVVEICLFPLLFYIIKPYWISMLIVMTLSFIMFFLNVFYIGLLK